MDDNNTGNLIGKHVDGLCKLYGLFECYISKTVPRVLLRCNKFDKETH